MTPSINNAIAELGRAYQSLSLAYSEVGIASGFIPQYAGQTGQIMALCQGAQEDVLAIVTWIQ